MSVYEESLLKKGDRVHMKIGGLFSWFGEAVSTAAHCYFSSACPHPPSWCLPSLLLIVGCLAACHLVWERNIYRSPSGQIASTEDRGRKNSCRTLWVKKLYLSYLFFFHHLTWQREIVSGFVIDLK